MKTSDTEWMQQEDALAEKLLQLHALSYVLYKLGTDLGEHLLSPNKDDIEPIEPLAKLSLRLFDEVQTHVAILSNHLRTSQNRGINSRTRLSEG